MRWPFRTMNVGDTLIIWDVPTPKTTMTAHSVARYHGWRMQTEQVTDGKRTGTRVTRLPDPNNPTSTTPSNPAPLAWPSTADLETGAVRPNRRHATTYPFESLEVGQTGVYTRADYDPEVLGRMRSAVPYRAKALGRAFTTRMTTTKKGTALGLPEYAELRVTRTK